jgi:hypothetical protein
MNSFITNLKLSFGYTADDFKDAGYNARQLYYDFRLSDLQRAGYTDRELKDFLNPSDNTLVLGALCNFGFTAKDFKNAGYDAKNLLTCFKPSELIEAGYTDSELRKAGFK